MSGEPPKATSEKSGVDQPEEIIEKESLDVADTGTAPVKEGPLAYRQEWVRAAVAIMLVLILGLIIVWAFIRTTGWNDTVDLLDRVLPAVTGLLGSVVGFYFATRQR